MLKFKKGFTWSVLILFIFNACQPPSTVPNVQNQSSSSQSPVIYPHPELSPAELAQGKALIRPGTQDRMELLRDEQGRVVSWMIIHDPPAKSQIAKPDTTDFQTASVLFQDKVPSDAQFCDLITIMQPFNIEPQVYTEWYSFAARSLTGEEKRYAHPDPWISTPGCCPVYHVRISHMEDFFGEIRTVSPRRVENHYRPDQPLFNISQPIQFPSQIRVKMPCTFHKSFALGQPASDDGSRSYMVSVNKTAACDGRSPAFSSPQVTHKTLLPQQQDEPNYCRPSVSRERLDPIDAKLHQLNTQLTHLEQGESGSFFIHSANQYPAQKTFVTQNFFSPGAPGLPMGCGDEEEYDPYDDQNQNHNSIYFHDKIPVIGMQLQINALKQFSDELENRLADLKQHYQQAAPSEAQGMRQHQLNSLGARQAELKIEIENIESTYLYLCETDLDSMCAPTPEIELIHAILELDGQIQISGRITHASGEFSFNDLMPDFDDQIELLESPQVEQLAGGRFTLTLPASSYKFTEQFWNSYEQANNPIRDLQNLTVTVRHQGFQTQSTGQNISSHQHAVEIMASKALLERAQAEFPKPASADEFPACQQMKEVFDRATGLMDLLHLHIRYLEEGEALLSRWDLLNLAIDLNALSWQADRFAQSCQASFVPNGPVHRMPQDFYIHNSPALLLPVAGTIAAISVAMIPALQKATEAAYAMHLAQPRENNDQTLNLLMQAIQLTGTAIDAWQLASGTKELWGNLQEGGKKEDITDWEPYDHAHHIVQKGTLNGELVDAQAKVRNCFQQPQPGEPFQPDQWNREKIDSKANGVVLHPWFHGLMHTLTSRQNINSFFQQLDEQDEAQLEAIMEACDLQGDLCQRVHQFLDQRLKPYLKQLNREYKAELERELLRYIAQNLGQTNLNATHLAIGQGLLKQQIGARSGKLEVNRLINAYRRKDSEGIGLTKDQKNELKGRMKQKVDNNNLKKPDYVDEKFDGIDNKDKDIKEFCRRILQYLQTQGGGV